jgi:hypothetical protein
MAATFLVALALGMQLRDWQGGGLAGKGSSLGNMTPAISVAGGPAQGPAAGPASPWQMVTLTTAGGPNGRPQSFQLPAMTSDHLDQAWLNSLPAAIPPEAIEVLRQSGHEVQQHRQLMPVEMQDGRRLVVPVDQVDIHYVGRPTL